MKNTFYIFILGAIIAGGWSGWSSRKITHVSANPRAVKVKKLPVKAVPKYVGIEAKIAEVFGEDAQTAIDIARCESSMKPEAIGDGGLNPMSYGLFQIRAFEGRAPIAELLTVDGNIKEAHRLFHASGWTIWSCFNRGNY